MQQINHLETTDATTAIRCESCGDKRTVKELLEVRFMFCDCGGEYYEYDDLPCPHYPD